MDLIVVALRLIAGGAEGLFRWAASPAERPAKRAHRDELVDELAQYPLTMIGRLANGGFARVMGRVTRLDPLTVEDRTGVVTIDLSAHARSSLRLRLELGEQVTAAGTACVDADPAWLAGGPYRGGAPSTRRLVGTEQKPLLLCDALDRIARKRGR